MMLDKVNRAYIALVTRAQREEGQAMVEYALILALVSVVAIGTLKLVGGNVNSVFTNINNKLTSAL
jgi:pilus assembly protein Flp/PilA